MLCLSGFELYSRWVPLNYCHSITSCPTSRLFTVLERFALRAAILHECQNYFSRTSHHPSPHPPPRAINPDARPPRYI